MIGGVLTFLLVPLIIGLMVTNNKSESTEELGE